MLKTKYMFFCLLFILLSEISYAETALPKSNSDQVVIGTKPEISKPGNCLTEPEYELGRLVNKIREQQHLPRVPIKESLYRVAKWHVIDLLTNTPHKDKTDKNGMPCNLHSWSDNGKQLGAGWEPLCYTADHKQALGMWKKPREISDHRSNGYENIYWTSAPVSPSMAINYWENSSDELDMILERSSWKSYEWRTMGVGILGNYVAVWFSVKPTSEPEMGGCKEVGN